MQRNSVSNIDIKLFYSNDVINITNDLIHCPSEWTSEVNSVQCFIFSSVCDAWNINGSIRTHYSCLLNSVIASDAIKQLRPLRFIHVLFTDNTLLHVCLIRPTAFIIKYLCNRIQPKKTAFMDHARSNWNIIRIHILWYNGITWCNNKSKR